MEPKVLNINGESVSCTFIEGDFGFKIYSAPKVEGWVIVIGEQVIIVEKGNVDYKTLSCYLTLPYQIPSHYESIKEKFKLFLKNRTVVPSL